MMWSMEGRYWGEVVNGGAVLGGGGQWRGGIAGAVLGGRYWGDGMGGGDDCKYNKKMYLTVHIQCTKLES